MATRKEEQAQEHAARAKELASEAGSAAAGSAVEAERAAKERLSQAGEATKDAGKSAAEATKQAGGKAADMLGSARDTVGTYLHEAEDKAAEAAAASKEMLTEAGGTVQSGVHSALHFIKEHLPAVAPAEDTTEERQSRALLDEALGHDPAAGGEPQAGRETTTTATAAGTQDRPTAEEVAVVEANRPTAAGLVKRANDKLERPGHTAEAALSAPPELKARMAAEREERGAKTLTQAVEDKLGEAKDYINPAHAKHAQHAPRMHEYRALPGDVHIPLVQKALREHILHRPGDRPPSPPATGGDRVLSPSHPGEAPQIVDSSLGFTLHEEETAEQPKPKQDRQEREPSARDRAAEVISDAQRRAQEAMRVAGEKTTEVKEKGAEGAHSLGDTLKDTLHSVEDKAKWAYQHAKEELHKSAETLQSEDEPRTFEEAQLAHGEIPYSTAEVLSKEEGKETGAGSSVAPPTPEKEPRASVIQPTQ